MGNNSVYARLKDYKLKYDINVLNSNENGLANYEQALPKYANDDGIIVTGLSSKKYTNMLNKLYEQNPNIVQVQAINEGAEYLFASKHNEKTASEMAAEFLYKNSSILSDICDCDAFLPLEVPAAPKTGYKPADVKRWNDAFF
ncbi:MAG: hypothetical protein J6B85_03745 [Lachnospiraceae bacterium]|nr:hypothetical protein [Lachnospiraceae bacterium]